MTLRVNMKCTTCGELNYELEGVDPNTLKHTGGEVDLIGQTSSMPCLKCGGPRLHQAVLVDDPRYQPDWVWEAREAIERENRKGCLAAVITLGTTLALMPYAIDYVVG